MFEASRNLVAGLTLIISAAGARQRVYRPAAGALPRRAAIGLSLLVLGSACGSGQQAETATESARVQQWRLPDRLREISGLALTADQRLLAVNDEQAVVYELDYEVGKISKTFTVGDPVLRGDFEGIAVLQGKVWLMTSDGVLIAAEEGADGRSAEYEKFTTGHGEYCELEGLAQDRAASTLLLACKETRAKGAPLLAFEWSVSSEGIDFLREIELPEQAAAERIQADSLNPSGIALDPASRDWLLVAARQGAFARLRNDGGLSEAIILPKKGRHRQAEGVEMTADGRLLIADEGGDGRATLAVYDTLPSGNQKHD